MLAPVVPKVMPKYEQVCTLKIQNIRTSIQKTAGSFE